MGEVYRPRGGLLPSNNFFRTYICLKCGKEISALYRGVLKKMTKKIHNWVVNWDDFEYYISDLEFQIKKAIGKGMKINNIYGVPRGGLVIAVRLSYLLNIPLITEENSINSNTLIIDDCIDTGQTLASAACGKHKIAVIFYCPDASFKPTFFTEIKSNTTYVVFPWEKMK